MVENWNFDYPKIAEESGFHFKQYDDGILDWRLISSIEIEQILKNKNIDRLDNIIPHLSEAPLGVLLKNQILDSGLTKYFTLSQLSIQYLLFCKTFLDETIAALRDSLHELKSENLRLSKIERDNNVELLQLHKEIQKLKEISEIVYPCSMCTKNFVSNEMLKVHIASKHSNEYQNEKKRTDDKNLINTIKLELEMKRLKERLNDAEKEFRRGSTTNRSSNCEDQMKKNSARDAVVVVVDRSNIGIQNEIIKSSDKAIQSNDTVVEETKKIIQIDKGIQSNLSEEKENDDIVQYEQNKILEIFENLSEKIDKLEKNKENNSQSNEKSLEKIEKKLLAVSQNLQEKTDREEDILNKIVNNINKSASTSHVADMEDIKDYITKTVAKLQTDHINQFNKVAEKIDLSCHEKLMNMKTEIDTFKLLHTSKEQFESKMPVKPIKSQTLSSSSNIEKIRRKSSPIEINVLESFTESDDDDDDGNHSFSLQSKPTSIKTAKNQQLNSKDDFRKQAIKMEKNRLKSLGIDPSTSSIPSASIPSIVGLLKKVQIKKKNKIPNFYATRNRIKQVVENISFEKNKMLQGKNKPQELIEKDKEFEKLSVNTNREEIKELPKEFDKTLTVVKPKEANSEIIKENSEQHNMNQTKLEFNAKLERILSSPIKKLNRIDNTNLVNNISVKQTNDDLIKPVPVPRKRIMFDIEKFRSSSSDTS